MSKQIHNLQQGSPEWHEFRATHFGASEAAAMLGLSPYMTRNELLALKATGISKSIDAGTQRVFDRGHETEIGGRAMAEFDIGEELYPVVVSVGNLSASVDGLTMDEATAFEHKQANAELIKSLSAGVLPDHHQPQCQQVLMLTGAQQLLFMCSDGTRENCASMIVMPDPVWRKRIAQGWSQFFEDMKSYQHTEAAPAIVVAAPDELPALMVQITGAVTASNLDAFKAVAMARIEAINTALDTDEDFAIADKVVKFLDDGEKRLALVKEQALSQTADIAALFATIDSISEQMRAKRLTLDKLVKARKDSIRAEIVQAGKDALRSHINGLNQRVGGAYLVVPANVDFAAAIKGKRTISSLHDACDTLLATAKIDANALADRIQINHQAIPAAFDFLFRDFPTICTKAADDFSLLVQSRIAAHEANEAAKREAERVRIEAETRAKIEAEQRSAEREQDQRNFERDLLAQPTAVAAVQVVAQPATVAPVEQLAAPARKTAFVGKARLIDRLMDELIPVMTEQELSDLCISAARMIANRECASVMN